EVPALVQGLRASSRVARACYRPPALVCPAFRHGIVSVEEHIHAQPDNFPLRNQKLGVPLQYGLSRFDTASGCTHWQALRYLFRWAFRGSALHGRALCPPVPEMVFSVRPLTRFEAPHASSVTGTHAAA